MLRIKNGDFDGTSGSPSTVLTSRVVGWENSAAGAAQWGVGKWVGFANRHAGGEGNGLMQTIDAEAQAGEYRVSALTTRMSIGSPEELPGEALSRMEFGYVAESGRVVLAAHEVVPVISRPSGDAHEHAGRFSRSQ